VTVPNISTFDDSHFLHELVPDQIALRTVGITAFCDQFVEVPRQLVVDSHADSGKIAMWYIR
jgi:hypothetical protein